MKQVLILLFSVLIFSCDNGKEQTNKATGKAPDTILTVIGFPYNGGLRIDFATVLSKDTTDWIDVDTSHKSKQSIRGKYHFVQIAIPDSVKGADGVIKPVLDSSTRQPKNKIYTLQVPDSLIYFPKELDIRKIKKTHNLK